MAARPPCRVLALSMPSPSAILETTSLSQEESKSGMQQACKVVVSVHVIQRCLICPATLCGCGS